MPLDPTPLLARRQPATPKPWSAAELLALADPGCGECFGLGRDVAGRDGQACECVGVGIFRACYRRYVACASGESRWGDPRSHEYIADFELVARRSLPRSWRAFQAVYVAGGQSATDANTACPVAGRPDRVGMPAPMRQRLEAIVGFAFRALQPYPLFPVSDYFSETTFPSLAAIRRRKGRG